MNSTDGTGGTGGAYAPALRAELAATLTAAGVLDDPAWRAAVETVPRHRFVPGFYLPAEGRGLAPELIVWEPLTAATDHGRRLSTAYTDTTLITQFDGEEPDWEHPARREGGAPTSSSTLPSLVARMWTDADLDDRHTVLEIGTGTGYSTALACERLGSEAVTSVDIDPCRLEQAAAALYGCGYSPDLAVADACTAIGPERPSTASSPPARCAPSHSPGGLRPVPAGRSSRRWAAGCTATRASC